MSPESSCIDKYLQQLACDNNIHVICPKANNSIESYGKLAIHNVSSFWNKLRCTCDEKLANGGGGVWRLILNMLRARGYLLSYFAFPTRNRWLKKAYIRELADLSCELEINAIISMGGLPCAHYAAYIYKIDHPNVRWITYTLDPFTINDDSYENVLFKKRRRQRNHQLELSFWENSDWNLFTEELLQPMIDEFGDRKGNYICFPYTLTKPGCEYGKSENNTGIQRAVYAGALYLNIRNPRRMLEVMSKVKGIRIELYTSGECDSIIRGFESETVHLMGKLARKNYLELINEKTDILINIANNMSLMAPSKFFELLSTGLPIINFYTIKNTNYYMTERYPLGINIGFDEENAVDKVQKFCSDVKGRRLLYKEVEDLFPEYCFMNQLLKLRKCLALD